MDKQALITLKDETNNSKNPNAPFNDHNEKAKIVLSYSSVSNYPEKFIDCFQAAQASKRLDLSGLGRLDQADSGKEYTAFFE